MRSKSGGRSSRRAPRCPARVPLGSSGRADRSPVGPGCLGSGLDATRIIGVPPAPDLNQQGIKARISRPCHHGSHGVGMDQRGPNDPEPACLGDPRRGRSRRCLEGVRNFSGVRNLSGVGNFSGVGNLDGRNRGSGGPSGRTGAPHGLAGRKEKTTQQRDEWARCSIQLTVHGAPGKSPEEDRPPNQRASHG